MISITKPLSRISPTFRIDQLFFFILVGLIALTAVPFASIEPWWEGIVESAILILAAGSIIANSGRVPWHIPAVVMPLIGLIAFACFQLLPLLRSSNESGPSMYETISSDPFETRRFIVKLIVVAVTLAMLARYTANRESLMMLMQLVAIVGVVSALCAVLRLVPNAASGSLFPSNWQDESFGQFTNRNHFALLMEMSIGPTSALLYLATTRVMRVLFGGALLLMGTALLSANSRGGVLSFAGQCTLFVWIIVIAAVVRYRATYTTSSRFWWQRILSKSRTLMLHSVLLLCLFAMVSASLVWLGGERIRQRLETLPAELRLPSNDGQNSGPRRLEIWSATWDLIKAHPFAGSGLGAYKTAISGHFQPVSDWRPEQAHNEYLELLAGAGIAGAVLGLWFVAVFCRELMQRLSEDMFRRVVSLGGALGLAGVAIHSLVDFGLHVMVNTLICTVLVALATVKFPSEPVVSSFE